MTNIIAQTLLGFPAFCLVLFLLILPFTTGKRSVNPFFISGCVLSLAQFVTYELFWISVPDVKELAEFSKVSILFYPVFVLFLYGLLQNILENNSTTVNHKQNVWILFILIVITLGLYVPVWYIKKYIKQKLGTFLIVVFVLFFTFSFYMHTYLFTEPNAIPSSIWLLTDSVTAILGIALAMNLRASIIKENARIELNPTLTIVFGVFYLQYKINQFESE